MFNRTLPWATCAIATLAVLLVSCAGSQTAGGRIEVSNGASGPTFDWQACTEFGTKRCGDKLKLISLLIKPLTCTVGGERSGERPTMWHIQVAGTFGASLSPPIRYGEVPTNVKVEVPAADRRAGAATW